MTDRTAPVWSGPREARDSARRGPTPLQYVLAVAAVLAFAWLLNAAPFRATGVLHDIFLGLFALASVLRLGLCVVAETWVTAGALALPPERLPAYTLIVPLYDEAQMLPGLMAALERLDYPADRLQVILALEPDDGPTRLAAVQSATGRRFAVEIALSPIDGPRTKPKACNAALASARGEIVTVYDAEDRPDPGQLKEAAARFAAGPPRLGCLQAPLRITDRRVWLQRQFALEYAALFEMALPAYARLGLPFPLGGTSNHFRRACLVEAGGWDAWNVTEDADMGLRLSALGWKVGVLKRPTWETAPATLDVWTAQRSRWVKGHMQTWGVHMRRPLAGGWRRALALQLTLGLSVASSLLHGALAAGVAACLIVAVASWSWPQLSPFDVWLLFGGWASAVVAMNLGARRARLRRIRWTDALTAPLYWPLQTVAAMFALWELATCPFHWSKTPHEPPSEDGLSADGA